MTLCLFLVIVSHSFWPVREKLSFDFVIYSPSTGSALSEGLHPAECGNTLRVLHVPTRSPGYFIKHLEIMDVKKLYPKLLLFIA